MGNFPNLNQIKRKDIHIIVCVYFKNIHSTSSTDHYRIGETSSPKERLNVVRYHIQNDHPL